MKKIQITIAPLPLLGAILSVLVAALTVGGQLQSWVHFAGVANEIAFFLLACCMSVCCLALAVEVKPVYSVVKNN